MKNRILVALAMVSVGIVAGCGGGSGSGTTTPTTTSISGKVADGYLANAKVFLDLNDNYQWDAGEPYAMTDANGDYTLNVDPKDLINHTIVALATKGVTIDSDTGVVANSYVLSMPKGSVSGTVNSNSNFISPISSQLREMMETGKYASVAQAMQDLSPKLGMPAGTNLLVNYMDPNAAYHTAMHTAAQKIATVMGGQMAQVMGTGSTPSAVQVDRYRNMMGAIFSNISSIKSTNPLINTAQIVSTISNTLINMPMASSGQPYRNMSTAFRGGMMGR